MLLSLSSPRRPSWFLRAYPTLPPLGGGGGGVNHFAGCMLVTATWTFCLSFRWVKRAHRVIQLPLGLLFFFFYLIPTYMPWAKNLQCGWVLLFVRWCRSFAGISNRANMLVAQSRRGVRSARRSPILYTTRFWAGVYVHTYSRLQLCAWRPKDWSIEYLLKGWFTARWNALWYRCLRDGMVVNGISPRERHREWVEWSETGSEGQTMAAM